jgi:hypothetical protein
MLRLSNRQFKQIAETNSLDLFENDMMLHLKTFVPRFAIILGDEGLRECIRFGIVRAKTYGVTNPGLLRFYIEAMFLFGGYFDADPLYPWAGRILCDSDLPNQEVRIERLYDATLEHLAINGGSGPKVALPVLRNLKRVISLELNDEQLDTDILSAWSSVHPARWRHLDASMQRRLVHLARLRAVEHNMATGTGTLVVGALMLTIGCGFMDDPMFHWIGKRLGRSSLVDPTQRALYLRNRTNAYLSSAIFYFEGVNDVP